MKSNIQITQEQTVSNSFNKMFWEDLGVSLISEKELERLVMDKSNGKLFPLTIYSEHYIRELEYRIEHKELHSKAEYIAENDTAPTALRKISNDFLNLYDKNCREARKAFLSNATQFQILVGRKLINIEGERFCYHCNTLFEFRSNNYRYSHKVFEQDVKYYYDMDNYYPKENLNSIRNYQRNNGLEKIKKELQEQDSFISNQLSHCPLCNSEWSNISYDIYEEVTKKEQSIAKKALDSFLLSSDIPQICEHSQERISKVKSNSEELKKYVYTLLELEVNIYSLSNKLHQLYFEKAINERQLRGEKLMFLRNETLKYKNILHKAEQEYESAQKSLQCARNKNINIKVNYPEQPTAPTLLKANFFNRKKIEALNLNAKLDYEMAMQAYRTEVDICKQRQKQQETEAKEQHQKLVQDLENNLNLKKNQLDDARIKNETALKEIDIKKESVRVPATILRDILDNDIKQAEDCLKKAYNCRNELYSCDIIFQKYRDIVALSTFYEYLSAGRCNALEGQGGAYNIFEMESRANMIISQLDMVIDSLDAIKQNQYTIYTKLSQVNSTLDKMNTTFSDLSTTLHSMNNKLDNIEKNSEVIAHNTAVNAYYSKINAQLTDSLGYMVALK